MNQKYENITMHQFDLMKHAVGLDRTDAKPKRGKYTAYRNYFCTYGKDNDWETLVECGVATYLDDVTGTCRYYTISLEGIKFMECVLGFEIIEEE